MIGGGKGRGTHLYHTTLAPSTSSYLLTLHTTSLSHHQDNFALSNPYESPEDMYETIQDVEENHVVTHESDHEWRNAVVTNQPSLLALRLINSLVH